MNKLKGICRDCGRITWGARETGLCRLCYRKRIENFSKEISMSNNLDNLTSMSDT